MLHYQQVNLFITFSEWDMTASNAQSSAKVIYKFFSAVMYTAKSLCGIQMKRSNQ